MADRIGVIRGGELILVEDKAVLMKSLGKKQLTLTLKEPLAALPADLWGEPLELSSDGLRLTYTFDAAGEASGIAGLMRRLGEAGVDFTDMATRESSLEDIFVSLVSTRA
jgi:ABC-2 type transport system ATP-binding protein